MKILLIVECKAGLPVTRPTCLEIDTIALLHNLSIVKQYAPKQQNVAMVKANAYGCGIQSIVSTLDPHVQHFGVACLEEAHAIKSISVKPILLLQGVFDASEWITASDINASVVIHHIDQLHWLLEKSLTRPITIWIKVDTGMHRLGFSPEELPKVIDALCECPWVHQPFGIMSHFARANEDSAIENLHQLTTFNGLDLSNVPVMRSTANSAAVMVLESAHYDVVRPGIMLYGASPLADRSAVSLNLKPVMKLTSQITVIHQYPALSPIGYSGIWQSKSPCRIGVLPIGYADGYPRVISENTFVWVNGYKVPIVGRISMDMMTIDITAYPEIKVGDKVELWGEHIPIDNVAKSAGTIAYELMTKVTARPHRIIR